MSWKRFSHGFRLDPIAKGSPEALVVLLHDLGPSAATLTPVAARWAPTVPTTAFVTLDGVEQLDLPSRGLPPQTIVDLNGGPDSAVLDRMARRLEALFDQQLRTFRLDASRQV